METPKCVINPKTGRAVRADSKLGKQILAGNVKKEPHTMYKKPIGPVKPKEPHTMYKKPIGPAKQQEDIFMLMKNFNNNFSTIEIEKYLKNNEPTRENVKKLLDIYKNKNEKIQKMKEQMKDEIKDEIDFIKGLAGEQKKILKEYITTSKESTLLRRFKTAKKNIT